MRKCWGRYETMRPQQRPKVKKSLNQSCCWNICVISFEWIRYGAYLLGYRSLTWWFLNMWQATWQASESSTKWFHTSSQLKTILYVSSCLIDFINTMQGKVFSEENPYLYRLWHYGIKTSPWRSSPSSPLTVSLQLEGPQELRRRCNTLGTRQTDLGVWLMGLKLRRPEVVITQAVLDTRTLTSNTISMSRQLRLKCMISET